MFILLLYCYPIAVQCLPIKEIVFCLFNSTDNKKANTLIYVEHCTWLYISHTQLHYIIHTWLNYITHRHANVIMILLWFVHVILLVSINVFYIVKEVYLYQMSRKLPRSLTFACFQSQSELFFCEETVKIWCPFWGKSLPENLKKLCQLMFGSFLVPSSTVVADESQERTKTSLTNLLELLPQPWKIHLRYLNLGKSTWDTSPSASVPWPRGKPLKPIETCGYSLWNYFQGGKAMIHTADWNFKWSFLLLELWDGHIHLNWWASVQLRNKNCNW